MTGETRFFKDKALEFIECRFSERVQASYKAHAHLSLSIGAITYGKSKYFVQERAYLLQKNELAIIKPEAVHACNPYESDARSYYMLYIEAAWFKRFVYDVLGKEIVLAEHLANKTLYSHFIRVCEKLMSESFYLDKEVALCEFLEALVLHEQNPAQQSLQDLAYLQELKVFLQHHWQENITLATLSEKFSKNVYTLLRDFKKSTGLPPHQYVLNLRIEKAKSLLQKRMRLVDVALECGFVDQSHFHRTFKQQLLVTPREYQLNFIQ